MYIHCLGQLCLNSSLDTPEISGYVSSTIVTLPSEEVSIYPCRLIESSIKEAKASPEMPSSQEKNPIKSSFHSHWLSTYLMTRLHCSICEQSAASSASTANYLPLEVSFTIFSLIQLPMISIKSFWIVFDRYSAFFGADMKCSCSSLSPESSRKSSRAWKFPGL